MLKSRVQITLAWAEQERNLLGMAVDHLSLGRIHYGLALSDQDPHHFKQSSEYLELAVCGLRDADQELYLPLGLLARAALRRVHGERTSAQADLDEAEEIAERGHMLLHLADVHLERTLLHLAVGEDALARERLDAAAELVERCGYGRRRDVAFLEGVLRGRPG